MNSTTILLVKALRNLSNWTVLDLQHMMQIYLLSIRPIWSQSIFHEIQICQTSLAIHPTRVNQFIPLSKASIWVYSKYTFCTD
ncbi:hypothetical protein TU79_21960 [Pseudomonas trivialis]|uniref:Uncharacterized protein n=1 Tax=Pseudomonas trivialis TaxID=200450 RepID=A0A0R2ZC49_9PSED|nr:hypothetical protein TU79_21960 [Pseudomonas trivialis]